MLTVRAVKAGVGNRGNAEGMKATNGQNGAAVRGGVSAPAVLLRASEGMRANGQLESTHELNGAAVKPLTIITEVVDYDSLHRALRERREQLDLPFTEVDKAGALTPGHASKILSPAKLKRASLTTVGYLAPALGAKLVLVEDLEALEHLRKHFRTRQVEVSARSVAWGRPGTQTVKSLRWVRRIGRAGGKARAQKLTPAQRAASARKAAKARWRKPKVVEITNRKRGSQRKAA